MHTSKFIYIDVCLSKNVIKFPLNSQVTLEGKNLMNWFYWINARSKEN